ncbi:MAG: DUF87 domain-containing protein [Geminicoccaceae bacterium]
MTLDEVATAAFRATRETDALAGELKDLLGFGTHNIPARLAIARSLAVPEAPPPAQGEPGRTIRGDVLFGTGDVLATWLSLLIEYEERPIESIADLQRRVRDHWVRGMKMLSELLESSNRSAINFWRRLAETALPSGRPPDDDIGPPGHADELVPRPIVLPIGPRGLDAHNSEPVRFCPVAPGASPHVAIMGGVGSGKTRTARFMLNALAAQARVPILAFDFKGDLAGGEDGLDRAFGAQVVDPLERPLPLDVLAFDETKPHALELTAQRLRDSLATLKRSDFGAQQRDLLAESTERALAQHRPCRLSDVRDALVALYREREKAEDGAVATLRDICRFELFAPELPPAAFFARSWVVRIGQDLPDLVRSVVVTLVTDALDRWLNSRPDAPVDADGNRALRIVAVIDEAHRVLGRKLPGLSNLVRLSRSKGGMVWLVSQSPDDFEGEEDDFLAEMGLVLAFATNARPGATRRIFGGNARLERLASGHAFAKLRGEPAREVVVWRAG